MTSDYRIQETASFEHDCDDCEFLGNTIGHDFYFCSEATGGLGSYIARWSSDGPDYVSGRALRNIDIRINIAISLHER